MTYWDNVWSNESFSVRAVKIGEGIHRRMNFFAYTKLLNPVGLKNLDIIEVGSGPGELTAMLVNKYGGTATLLDQSENAFKLARNIFKNYDIPLKTIKKDLLKFSPKKKYDLVHSEGLIEHFVGKKQDQMVKAHKRCVKRNGHILISVPRNTWYSDIWKNSLIKINKWPFGFEKPMDAKKLGRVLKRNGLKVLDSFNYRRYAFALAKV